ncbi:triose-phosphate isomerase [Bauldia litoralis]|uniref:triose-phosphate isomerase n=1 Tax=Bauldia litoralis TaxID=665467 RepID=UPI0032648D39
MAVNRPLIAGNWKMNGVRANLAEIDALVAGIAGTGCDVAICPPATLIAEAAGRAGDSGLMIGGQDCHTAANGAHTGDTAAEMIADAGGKLVIVGHSERRADHGEGDALVRAKAEAGWRARLLVILCVGETEAHRRADQTLDVLSQQLAGSVPDGATADKLVVAYEPVWAIGTGLTPSNDDIQAAHAHIRGELVARLGPEAVGIRLLYGGSVKPGNASEILPLPDVDGALVGGASLKAADFLGIVAPAG